MADRTVSIDILGRDKTSPAFRSASRSTSRMGDTMKKVAKIASVGLAAGVGLGALAVKDFIAEGREANKVGALTKAVLKSTGGAAKVTAKQVEDLATRISEKSGIDDEAIQTGENLLLTFKGIRNEAGAGNKIFDKTTQIMVDMGVALGTDASGAAIKLGKALNDPVKGITALTRVGVTFTEKQKASIAAMVAAGNTMGAQKVILRELKSEFGGAAAAVATPWDKLKVKLQNIEEEIGKKLIPKLDQLATWISDVGIPALQNFAAWFSEHVTPKIRALRNYMVNSLFPAMQALAKDILPQTQATLAQFVTGINQVTAAWRRLTGQTNKAGESTNALAKVFGFFIKGFLVQIQVRIQVLTAIMTGLLNVLNAIKNAAVATGHALANIKAPHLPNIPGGWHVPDIPGFAAGGIVTRPTLAMVGDAGPEAIIPLSRGGGGGGAGAMRLDDYSIERLGQVMGRVVLGGINGSAGRGSLLARGG